MDEEVSIINTNNRNEKIKNFLVQNKKVLISISSVLIIILLSFYSYKIYKNLHREDLANKFNNAVIEYESGNKSKVISSMKEVVRDKDSTYSPLGMYFLIDNDLINNVEEANELFDVLINNTKLEKEIKNLIIYKKALFNSNLIKENELLQMLNPIINSESIWKSHSLYLLGEYFYSNNQNQKAKEFFNQIILLKNSNVDIKLESQKRIKRDFGE